MSRRVLQGGLALTLAAALIMSATGAATARLRVAVRPATGSPRSHFVVRFRNPERTGRQGALRISEVLSATGPHRRGCVSRVAVALRPAAKGRRVRVTLNPRRLGGVWCDGRFRGRIVVLHGFICRPPGACAGPTISTRTLAHFSFQVKRAPRGGGGSGSGGGAQGQGPSFAGLVSATTCGGPSPLILPPKSRTFFLRWDPATDPATPSPQIVYDIFFSTTPGGEDFASPIATTPTGVTSYAVHTAGGGPAYFVVRARDQAGREDQNTVERAAVTGCG